MKAYFEVNSNNELIHFTKSLAIIKSILSTKSLRLKYCKEEFSINYEDEISRSVHPMVCFSEQNLLQLGQTEITYGRYGVAFSNDWIIKKNIQPVMYVEQNSPVADSLAKLLNHRRTLPKGNTLRLPIMTIKCFVKNTVGYNSKFDISDFVFKQENEWRYVPKRSEIKTYISESISTYEKNEVKYNNRLLKYPLRFDIKTDIIRVYCENKSDIKILRKEFLLPKDKVRIAPWK